MEDCKEMIAKVKGVHLVNIFCTKCNTIMDRGKNYYPTHPPKYDYVCPNCGNTAITSETYPQYKLELGKYTDIK